MSAAQDKEQYICLYCLICKCIVKSVECVFIDVFLYCLITCIFCLPALGLLGSGWLGCLPLSGSFGLHTLNYYSIVYLLQVVYSCSVYPCAVPCHTIDEPYSTTGDLYLMSYCAVYWLHS